MNYKKIYISNKVSVPYLSSVSEYYNVNKIYSGSVDRTEFNFFSRIIEIFKYYRFYFVI